MLSLLLTLALLPQPGLHGALAPHPTKPGRAMITWSVGANVGSWWLWHCPATDGACTVVDRGNVADHGSVEVFAPAQGELWMLKGYVDRKYTTVVFQGDMTEWSWVMLPRIQRPPSVAAGGQ